MKMQIKGILFDFDGTIANTIDLIIATLMTYNKLRKFNSKR